MNRKILICVLAVSAAFFTFAGCGKGNSEPASEPVSQSQSEAGRTESEAAASEKNDSETGPEQTSAAAEETGEADVYSAFKKCLENAEINGVLPKYSVFDIDGDGTAELMIFDERIATAIERGITVYTFDAKSNTAKKIGRAETFEGHSRICAAADGNGFIIQQDYPGFIKVTRYTFNGVKLSEEKLIDKTYNGDNINGISEDLKGNEYLGSDIISSLNLGEGEESRLFEKAFG